MTLLRHWGWAVLIGVAALVSLWTRPLLPADETRYAAVAWEMWRDGQWWLPTLNGVPYSHKPPLLFWLIHAGWGLFGVNEWWPRLPGTLAAIATGWLTRRLGQHLFPEDARIGEIAPWLLVGSLYWLVDSTMLMFDHLLGACVALGWLGLLRWRDGLRGGLALAALGSGLGLLTKGPVALLFVLPAGALAVPAGLDGRRALLQAGAALLGASAIALAWLGLAPGGSAYAAALWRDLGAGRLVGAFAHALPVWWYLPLLPLLWLPWSATAAFWHGLAAGVREGIVHHRPGPRFCVVVAGAVFAVLSLISGKQPHYLLPLFPLLALLLAAALTARGGAQRCAAALPVMLIGVLLAALPLAAGRLPWAGGVSPGWGLSLATVAALAGWRSRGAATATAIVAGMLVTLLLVAGAAGVAPHALANADLRALSRDIGAQQRARAVAFVGTYRGQFTFAGRLHKPLETLAPQDVRAWLRAHPQGLVIGELRTLDTAEARAAAWTHPYRSRYFAGWTVQSLETESAALPETVRGAQPSNHGPLTQ